MTLDAIKIKQNSWIKLYTCMHYQNSEFYNFKQSVWNRKCEKTFEKLK